MLIILEVLFFIFGLYVITTAKLPAFLIGGGGYRIEGPNVRLLGLLLAIPLPGALVVGFIMGFLFGEQVIGYLTICEVTFVILVAVIAVIAVHKIRVPVEME